MNALKGESMQVLTKVPQNEAKRKKRRAYVVKFGALKTKGNFGIVAKFSSSGREDVDVRTLGRGRPFMFEIVNSRKVNFTLEELSNIQSKINSKSKDIYVRDLQVVKKESI